MDQSDQDLMRLACEEAARSDERWWYLSFADEAGWLGGTVVKARGMAFATMEAHRLGVNPGGEVRGWEGRPGLCDPPPELRRLVTDKAELDRLSEVWMRTYEETSASGN